MTTPVPFWFEPGATLECDPLLAGDRLLIAALDATIHAVEPATGRRIWSSKLRGTMVHGLVRADGVVYLTVAFTGFSGPGTVCALDGDSGNSLWVHKSEEHVGTGPAVAEGLVFYGTAFGSIRERRGVLVARVRSGKGKRGTALAVGVDSGYVALLSVEAAGRLVRDRVADERFGESAKDRLDACYRPTRSWASVVVANEEAPDVFMCSSGLGDGQYPVFLGLGPSGRPVALLVDLKVLENPASRIVDGGGPGARVARRKVASTAGRRSRMARRDKSQQGTR